MVIIPLNDSLCQYLYTFKYFPTPQFIAFFMLFSQFLPIRPLTLWRRDNKKPTMRWVFYTLFYDNSLSLLMTLISIALFAALRPALSAMRTLSLVPLSVL